jgi:hypothetical protein
MILLIYGLSYMVGIRYNLFFKSEKTGLIDPLLLSFKEALSLMIRDPILNKRPLVDVDDLYIPGFEDQLLRPSLGCWDEREDVITCPNL